MEKERIKIDRNPVKLRLDSEPYVFFMGKKYAAVVDVYELKRKREYFLIIEPQSLSIPLHQLQTAEGKLLGLVIWLSKESDDKFSKYEVTLA